MKVAIRLLLSLLICLALPVQANAALLAGGACSGAHMSVKGTMQATTACSSSHATHMRPTGTLCRVGSACSPTLPSLHLAGIPSIPYQQVRYPQVAVHFILQSFPRALLRPPSLG